jgi:uncharacterized protein
MRLSFRDLRKAKQSVLLDETVSLPRIVQDHAQVVDMGPIQCALVVDSAKPLYRVHGTLEAVMTYVCSRCLEPFHRQLQTAIDERFTEDAANMDDDLQQVTGDDMDFDPIIEQAVNLAIEFCPVCTERCQGLCPVCGCNRNEQTCTCETKVVDPRFGALQDLLSSDKSK